jgi:hypothetical protein
VSIPNKRFGSLGLSDIVITLTSRQAVEEGPADFVNFHLDGDRVLSCGVEMALAHGRVVLLRSQKCRFAQQLLEMDELAAGRHLSERLVGFGPAEPPVAVPQQFPPPTGFPRKGPSGAPARRPAPLTPGSPRNP